MRLFRLKRETTVGDFGLYNAQLYVGEFSDPKENRIKGMAILIPSRAFEFPFEVKSEDAISIAHQLKEVTPANPNLDVSIRVGWLSRFRLSLDKYLDNWLDSDGYSGGITIYGNWVPIKVTRNTLAGLSDCLDRFYK